MTDPIPAADSAELRFPPVPARGAARPGMREVAEHAGVAMSSVSRVLNDHPDVSPKMREAVMRAVRELSYRPDMLAQALRRGKTFSVGFTVSDISNAVLADSVTGAEKRLRAAGYSLLLTNSEGMPELDVEHILLFERRRVDGLILALADENHPETVAALRGVSVPIVLVDRQVPSGVNARCVAFDHALGMSAATAHLLALGHRNFALITGGPERPARERRRAVEDTLAAARVGARFTVYSGEFSIEHGGRAMNEILASDPRPTAIVAGGNMLMQGALLALRDSSVVLGRDVSFVGCDAPVIAALHTPQIAIVRRDMLAIGEAAAETLLRDLDEDGDGGGAGADGAEVVLPTEFIPNASCGPAPPGTS